MSSSTARHLFVLRLAVRAFVLATAAAIGVLVVDQAMTPYSVQFRVVGLVLVLGLAVTAIGARAIAGHLARGPADGASSPRTAWTWLVITLLAVGCLCLCGLVVAMVDRMVGGLSLLG